MLGKLRLILIAFALLGLLSGQARAQVKIQETPDGGLQPRLIQDDSGDIHLLYFRKRIEGRGAREGNLYYRPYLAAQGRFGDRVRVSSQAFNLQSYAIARAAMASDGNGRLHVLWYLPRDSAFYYSRSNPERTSFEPQKLIVTEKVEGIDAGGDIAATGDSVAITWGAGDLSREYERTMFARFSIDGGDNFGEELMVSNPDLGACACCSMATDYLDDNELLVAYRSAINGVGRHMQLLTVAQSGASASSASYGPVRPLQEWEVSFCPLSTNDIASEPTGYQWLAFETESRIVQLRLPDGEPMLVAEPFTETRQKNPAIAFNNQGQWLVVWGEAISHTRGGRLNMRLFDADGAVESFAFDEEVQIGDFSFPAAAALPSGEFLVLH